MAVVWGAGEYKRRIGTNKPNRMRNIQRSIEIGVWVSQQAREWPNDSAPQGDQSKWKRERERQPQNPSQRPWRRKICKARMEMNKRDYEVSSATFCETLR